ncbi:single-stranded DNA-binding protein [bacterium]|nr:single-stranded DNA-binding protein [bacterium]MBU1983138.1 single-stranded DNA-binding protein [bacterium]
MADLRMPDINSVIIVGNLIKDPTFRTTTTGVPVANFTIASNRKFKDNSGVIKEDVCFIGVVAWYKLAESCYENLRKGSAILVEGELQSRSWKTEDGFNRSTVEIKARRIQFLNYRDSHPEETTMTEQESEPSERGTGDEAADDRTATEKADSDFGFGYRGIKV